MGAFIAVGCRSGKVFVFDVLGLLIYKVEKTMPIVALDWINELNATAFPRPRRSHSSSGEKQKRDCPVPEPAISQYEALSSSDEAGEASETVRRTSHPHSPGSRTPIRFDGGRDLFSLEQGAPRIPRASSEFPNDTPLNPQEALEPCTRRSFLRPRLATETFEDPFKAPIPPPAVKAALLSPGPVALEDIFREKKARHVFDVFFADALRVSPSRSVSSASVQSRSSETGIFSKSPKNQKRTEKDTAVSYDYACTNRKVQPSRSRSKRRRSSAILGSSPSPPFRRGLLPDPDFLKHDSYRKSANLNIGLAERSRYFPLHNQQRRTDINFEPMPHTAEPEREVDSFEVKRGHTPNHRKIGYNLKESPLSGNGKSGTSSTNDDLKHEHRRLMHEVVLLRKEFRRLRQTLVDLRR